MILDPQWWPTQACVCDGAEYKLGLPSTPDVSAHKHYGHRDGDKEGFGRIRTEQNRSKPSVSELQA
jgi:hypothetical protein